MNKLDEFLDLAKQYESISESLSKVREQMQAVMMEIGVDKYHQDPTTGLVYKIVRPKGTFIEFRVIDYVRTKKENERQGTLSKSEAEKAGFKLNE